MHNSVLNAINIFQYDFSVGGSIFMGFFGFLMGVGSSLVDSMQKKAIANIKSVWEKMDRISSSRVREILEERRQRESVIDVAGALAVLTLIRRGDLGTHSDLLEDNALQEKVKYIKKMIELETDGTFDKIRDAIKEFERLIELPSYLRGK